MIYNHASKDWDNLIGHQIVMKLICIQKHHIFQGKNIIVNFILIPSNVSHWNLLYFLDAKVNVSSTKPIPFLQSCLLWNRRHNKTNHCSHFELTFAPCRTIVFNWKSWTENCNWIPNLFILNKSPIILIENSLKHATDYSKWVILKSMK